MLMCISTLERDLLGGVFADRKIFMMDNNMLMSISTVKKRPIRRCVC